MNTILKFATIIGAIVAIISFLFKAPHWTIKKEVVIKAAVALGIGLCAGFIVLGIGFLTTHGKAAAGKAPNSPSNTASATSSPTAGAKPPKASLVFRNLSNAQNVGHHITVTLTGTVPSGERVWVFVKSLNLYYVQGRAQSQSPGLWSLTGVTFGSSAAGDINAPYKIYAVVADQQADRKISDLLKKTKGNTGTSVIPGDGGAKKVAHITVIRNH